MKEIRIKGARIHNLKNIDISLPKNKFIVATGVSGSGKSSLVFDIIFEEGRKQYLQSLGMLSTIDDTYKFDYIEGIGPTIAVHQNTIRQSNPRSTVGTRTGILHMLTLLYSGEGQAHGEGINGDEHLDTSFFSYNSASGMCVRCSGRGAYFEIDMEKLVMDNQITLEAVFIKSKVTPGYMNVLKRRFKDYFYMPFTSLPEDVKNEAVYGRYENGKSSYSLTKAFESRYRKGEALNDIYAMQTCCECHGYRIGQEGRSVYINGKHIGELCLMPISDMHSFLKETIEVEKYTQFGKNLAQDILIKLEHLIKAKLGYLTLYREMASLSGGELQRLFLNAHLDTKMDSLIYVLDEPTAGLHASEKEDIIASIQQLKEIGNTVIVVEHDKSTIQKAEHIIDIGPMAGHLGGQIVYQGHLDGLIKSDESITGNYLSGKKNMPTRRHNVNIEEMPSLVIQHAKTNNLKDITVTLPLHAIVGIAGKSGSGKSSLISDTLLPLLRTHFKYSYKKDLIDDYSEETVIKTVADGLEGVEFISGYAEISQVPIGRNNNSNPASYIGIWDKIRTLYANQPEAINKGFVDGHFSFNSKGACSECGGSGYEKIWLGRHLSINKTCTKCHGRRFNQDALSIKYKERTIFDVLEMSIDQAIEFFDNQPSILNTLKILQQIGMGYIKLGQPTPTLSGGESQRIKLAKEIGKKRKGNILYILDEPTTGLSQHDIAKLIELLDQLVEKGNSIIVIEHDIDVLKVCDYLIELGPVGGTQGGYVIAKGTPEIIKNNTNSITGRYL
ncbi:excinuclease ABC subunit UvrA [Desnuesiella massiliensis]|uniref:excinuclease ABC subunit UvrA n=1 Tax=Desnuesiella massiliensis TaxID=1650662 RepID=UPI0006E37270|nr:excinuclease ABC subunit UvrA [Desnuesiella massiliensis]